MKKSTIITIAAFVLGLVVLAAGFILLTDNNISNKIFAPKDTTTTTTTTTGKPNGGEPLPEYDPMAFFDIDMTQYITLGQYKDLVIEADKLEFSDEEVDFEIYKLLCVVGELTKVREGNVTEKVVFNFDYTGYFANEDGTRGEKFEGGAATSQLAYIDGDNFITLSSNGEGSFIDGFAQGMINATVGETFQINITFPSNYSPEMANKKTIFEVKVNFVCDAEPSDGWVKEYTKDQYKTVEEYKKSVKDELDKGIKSNNVNLLWKKIIENATVLFVPQEQLDILYNQFVAEVESYVLYSEYYFGTKLDFNGVLAKLGFKDTEELRDYAKEIIEGDLVYYAVIQAENLTASDEEYRLFLETIVEQTGKSEEEILKTYTEDYIRKQIVLNELDDHVYELNTFVLKTEE